MLIFNDILTLIFKCGTLYQDVHFKCSRKDSAGIPLEYMNLRDIEVYFTYASNV